MHYKLTKFLEVVVIITDGRKPAASSTVLVGQRSQLGGVGCAASPSIEQSHCHDQLHK